MDVNYQRKTLIKEREREREKLKRNRQIKRQIKKEKVSAGESGERQGAREREERGDKPVGKPMEIEFSNRLPEEGNTQKRPSSNVSGARQIFNKQTDDLV